MRSIMSADIIGTFFLLKKESLLKHFVAWFIDFYTINTK